tara:strand:- start:225 stop:482 length:258 start_codon:yes stop_codon:yes gene_type:complete
VLEIDRFESLNGDFLLVLPVKKEKTWRRRRQAGGLKEERKGKGGAGKEKEGLDNSWAITMAPCAACFMSRRCVRVEKRVYAFNEG